MVAGGVGPVAIGPVIPAARQHGLAVTIVVA
jgi:hypothetical protein